MDAHKTVTALFKLITGVADNAQIPREYRLDQNYPNPFNPTTTIDFALKQSGHTTIKIYDALGREIVTLVDKKMEAGNYQVIFKALNLASGIYFYKIKSGNFMALKKMILMK